MVVLGPLLASYWHSWRCRRDPVEWGHGKNEARAPAACSEKWTRMGRHDSWRRDRLDCCVARLGDPVARVIQPLDPMPAHSCSPPLQLLLSNPVTLAEGSVSSRWTVIWLDWWFLTLRGLIAFGCQAVPTAGLGDLECSPDGNSQVRERPDIARFVCRLAVRPSPEDRALVLRRIIAPWRWLLGALVPGRGPSLCQTRGACVGLAYWLVRNPSCGMAGSERSLCDAGCGRSWW